MQKTSRTDETKRNKEEDLSSLIPMDNLRRLARILGEAMDLRISDILEGTPVEQVRPSDAQVVVSVARGHTSISDIAKNLGVSRQAIHMSAQRLMEFGLIEMKPVPNNKRDKRLVVTPLGARELKRGAKLFAEMEAEFDELLGPANMAKLRKQLNQIHDHLIERHAMRKKK